MADLKIYNNGEGKILFSAGDRIIRQPYEFGNAFQNRMGLTNYILVDSLNIPQYYTLISWFNSTIEGGAGYPQHLFGTKSLADYTSIGSFGNTGHLKNFVGTDYRITTNSIARGTSPLIAYTNEILYCSVDSIGNIGQIGHRGLFSSDITGAIPGNNVESITISGNVSNLSTGNIRSSGHIKFNTFSLFNRILTLSELRYYYNNRVGSDFQSKLGLIIDLNFNSATIVAIDGVEYVGLEDMSGNGHHGKIMNLPNGTLQEQLDWANANLFVPFIS